MANRFLNVFARFKAINEVSAPVKKMTQSVDSLTKATNKLTAFQGKLNKVQKGFTGTLKGATAGVVGLGFGVKAILKDAAAFEQAMVEAGGNFPHETIVKGTKEFDELSRSVKEMAVQTEFSASDAGHALVVLSQAQFTSQKAFSALPRVANLATAGHLSFARAASISADILDQFSLRAEDAEMNTKNLTRITDALVTSQDLATGSIEQNAVALQEAGASGARHNQTLETTLALITGIASVAKGGPAGTRGRNIIETLFSDRPELTGILSNFEIQRRDANKVKRPLLDILADVEKAIESGRLSLDQFVRPFGETEKSSLAALFSIGIKNIKAREMAMVEASGAAEKLANIMRGTLGVQLTRLNSAFVNLKIDLFSRKSEKITNSLDRMTERLRQATPAIADFGGTALGFLFDHAETIIKIGAGWAALLATLHVTKTVLKAISLLRLAPPFVAWTAAILGTTTALKWFIDNKEKLRESGVFGKTAVETIEKTHSIGSSLVNLQSPHSLMISALQKLTSFMTVPSQQSGTSLGQAQNLKIELDNKTGSVAVVHAPPGATVMTMNSGGI
jgi:TP901 family phage tail tape measure protein